MIPKKIQKDRWRLAQEYQKRNQLKKKEKLTSFNHSQPLYSEEPYLIKFLSRFKKITGGSKILELGSGPH